MAIYEPTDTIEIKRVNDDVFIVEYKFSNGWSGAQRCDSERDARIWVDGFCKGINAVKNMIGIGPHFDGRVHQNKAGG
jgi:hypothetical protein